MNKILLLLLHMMMITCHQVLRWCRVIHGYLSKESDGKYFYPTQSVVDIFLLESMAKYLSGHIITSRCSALRQIYPRFMKDVGPLPSERCEKTLELFPDSVDLSTLESSRENPRNTFADTRLKSSPTSKTNGQEFGLTGATLNSLVRVRSQE